jgi:Protein of unknown function (DUF1566)
MTRAIVLLISLCTASSLLPNSSYAVEDCGFVSKQSGEFADERRFELLAEYDGRALIDKRTCLVWRLDVNNSPTQTLDSAMGECASLGQGGPNGDMGWQLPSLSELTSVDSPEWEKQRDEFAQYKIPALSRSEIDFWTSTPWLGRPDSWSVVQFSARTTIPHPVPTDGKAAVWCVLGHYVRGLR